MYMTCLPSRNSLQTHKVELHLQTVNKVTWVNTSSLTTNNNLSIYKISYGN